MPPAPSAASSDRSKTCVALEYAACSRTWPCGPASSRCISRCAVPSPPDRVRLAERRASTACPRTDGPSTTFCATMDVMVIDTGRSGSDHDCAVTAGRVVLGCDCGSLSRSTSAADRSDILIWPDKRALWLQSSLTSFSVSQTPWSSAMVSCDRLDWVDKAPSNPSIVTTRPAPERLSCSHVVRKSLSTALSATAIKGISPSTRVIANRIKTLAPSRHISALRRPARPAQASPDPTESAQPPFHSAGPILRPLANRCLFP